MKFLFYFLFSISTVAPLNLEAQKIRALLNHCLSLGFKAFDSSRPFPADYQFGVGADFRYRDSPNFTLGQVTDQFIILNKIPGRSWFSNFRPNEYDIVGDPRYPIASMGFPIVNFLGLKMNPLFQSQNPLLADSITLPTPYYLNLKFNDLDNVLEHLGYHKTVTRFYVDSPSSTKVTTYLNGLLNTDGKILLPLGEGYLDNLADVSILVHDIAYHLPAALLLPPQILIQIQHYGRFLRSLAKNIKQEAHSNDPILRTLKPYIKATSLTSSFDSFFFLENLALSTIPEHQLTSSQKSFKKEKTTPLNSHLARRMTGMMHSHRGGYLSYIENSLSLREVPKSTRDLALEFILEKQQQYIKKHGVDPLSLFLKLRTGTNSSLKGLKKLTRL